MSVYAGIPAALNGLQVVKTYLRKVNWDDFYTFYDMAWI